jgi:hypothetical protein
MTEIEAYNHPQISELITHITENYPKLVVDHDNFTDTVQLTNELEKKFPKLSFSRIFVVAREWTGYQESLYQPGE